MVWLGVQLSKLTVKLCNVIAYLVSLPLVVIALVWSSGYISVSKSYIYTGMSFLNNVRDDSSQVKGK